MKKNNFLILNLIIVFIFACSFITPQLIRAQAQFPIKVETDFEFKQKVFIGDDQDISEEVILNVYGGADFSGPVSGVTAQNSNDFVTLNEMEQHVFWIGIGSGDDFITTEDANVGIGVEGTAPTRRLSLVDPGLGFDRISANVLGIYTNNTEMMRVSNGFIGIDKSDPQSTLDVDGLIKMRSVPTDDPYSVINHGYLDAVIDALETDIGDVDASKWDLNNNDLYPKQSSYDVIIGDNFLENSSNKLEVVGGNISATGKLISGGDLNVLGDGPSFISGRLGVGGSAHSDKTLSIHGSASIGSGFSANDAPSNGLIVEGNMGIGTNDPGSLLTIANNEWISAVDSGGNGFVNMFRVNTNNQIEVGGPLNIGSFEFSPDSGLVTFVDMPVTSASSVGTEHGYALKIDRDTILGIYAEADGVGGIQNERIGIGTMFPDRKLSLVDPGLGFDRISANVLGIYTNNTEMMRVSNGFIGIDKSDPQSTLDVDGLIKMRSVPTDDPYSVINHGYLDAVIDALETDIGDVDASKWDLNNNDLYPKQSSYDVIIGDNFLENSSNKLEVVGGNISATGKLISGGDLNVLGGGPSYISGRLGVGGSADSSDALKVHGSSEINGNLNVNSSGSSNNIFFRSSGQGGDDWFRLERTDHGSGAAYTSFHHYGGTSGIYFSPNSGNSLGIGVDSSQFVISSQRRVDVNDDKLFVVNHSGEVGIGTHEPSRLLDVNGDVEIADRVYFGGATTYISAEAASDGFRFRSAGEMKFYTGGFNERMTIDSGGNVGIGTESPNRLLSVNGNVGAVEYFHDSDLRLKTNIISLENSLDKVNQLNPVSFTWKRDGSSSLGFIAQEMEAILPELVDTNEKNNLKSVKYANITALLVGGMKEQQEKIDSLEKEIELLKKIIENLDIN